MTNCSLSFLVSGQITNTNKGPPSSFLKTNQSIRGGGGGGIVIIKVTLDAPNIFFLFLTAKTKIETHSRLSLCSTRPFKRNKKNGLRVLFHPYQEQGIL